MFKKSLNGLALVLLACAGLQQASAQEAGVRGSAVRGAVVNFMEAARQDALGPESAELVEPVAIHSPKRSTGDLPVPEGADVVSETPASHSSAQADSSFTPSPGPSASFLGSADNTTSVPPDTHGAVGPNHMMVALNGGFLSGSTNAGIRVMDRAGNLINTMALTTFFGGVSVGGAPNSKGLIINNRAFDPRVFYDSYAGRWIIVAVADSRAITSSVVIAVSQSADPTGNWNLYQADADAGTDPNSTPWADYPSVGFNGKWIVVSVNMFPINTGSTSVNTYAFDKAKLYAGGAGDFTKFSNPTSTFGATHVAAVTYDPSTDPSTPIYLVAGWNSGSGHLRVFNITGAVGSETFNTPNLFPQSSAGGWASAPPAQPGTNGDFAPQLEVTRKLQNNDSRIQNAVFRNGSLWVAHTIFLPAGSGATRSAVQWWQINPTNGSVIQRGRIDDPTGGSFYAFPSIAVNRDNDVLVGYSRFGRNQFASANYSYRDHTDAPSTMRDSVIMKRGEGAYEKTFSGTTNRWGDYSATVVDPADDTSMWTLQEYAAAPVSMGNGAGRWGVWWSKVTPGSTAPSVDPVRMRLNGTTQSVNESLGKIEIPVTRVGDTGATALVDYATSGGTASDRADYIPAIGTLRFAPGETTKNITVFINNDALLEPSKTFNLTLMGARNGSLETPTALTVTIDSDDAANGPNPMREATFNADFFVRQHYIDFFSREADAPGLAFWTNELTSCGTDAACLDNKKQNVSAAFFLSIEFQKTGYFVYKTYGAAFGTTRVGSTVPLTLLEFLPDTQRIGRGVIVNQGNWEQQLEANKTAYYIEFVQSPQFLAQYPESMTGAAYVDKLNANIGNLLTQAQKDDYVQMLALNSGVHGRSTVLRAIVDNADFDAREKNRAFVLMQYIGYLRRNPPDAPELNLDYGGYNFWLSKLNNHGGDAIAAQMVRSFLVSGEYQERFGQ